MATGTSETKTRPGECSHTAAQEDEAIPFVPIVGTVYAATLARDWKKVTWATCERVAAALDVATRPQDVAALARLIITLGTVLGMAETKGATTKS